MDEKVLRQSPLIRSLLRTENRRSKLSHGCAFSVWAFPTTPKTRLVSTQRLRASKRQGKPQMATAAQGRPIRRIVKYVDHCRAASTDTLSGQLRWTRKTRLRGKLLRRHFEIGSGPKGLALIST